MKRVTFAFLMLLIFVAVPIIEAADSSPPVGIELMITIDAEKPVQDVSIITQSALAPGYMILCTDQTRVCNIIEINVPLKTLNSQSNLDSFLGPGDNISSSDVKVYF